MVHITWWRNIVKGSLSPLTLSRKVNMLGTGVAKELEPPSKGVLHYPYYKCGILAPGYLR